MVDSKTKAGNIPEEPGKKSCGARKSSKTKQTKTVMWNLSN